jgi:hypothetical protein
MRCPSVRCGVVSAFFSVVAFSSAASAATIAVAAGGNLQTALNAAQPGDVITLAAGATYVGNFVLPNKGALTDYITIRSSAPDASLPPAGVRVTPADAPRLPKIRSSNTSAALHTAAATNHWRLVNIEFLANQYGYGDIITLGTGDSSQSTLSQVPYAIVLDRVYVHGDPVFGQKRGIGLHSSDTSVINSYVSECKAIGQDSQALSGFNGPGNYLIENNYLEGATENVLFGGADPTIPNLVTSNIVFKRNYLRKPLSWRDAIVATPTAVAAARVAGGGSLPAGTYFYKVVARVTSYQGSKANSAASVEVSATIPAATTGGITVSWTPVVGAEDYVVYGRVAGAENMYWKTTTPYLTDTGVAGTAGVPVGVSKWSVKNTLELKNAQDVIIEGNVFDNVWVADHTGYPIVFTPRNQGGHAPWVVVQRITFQYNLIRHAAGGVNILGTDDVAPSQRTNNITVRHNVFDDLTAATWGSGARPFMIGDGPDAVTLDHNTVISTDTSLVWMYGGSPTSPIPVTRGTITNNSAAHNTYGIIGSSAATGLTAINTYLPSGIVTRNVLAGGSASKYPASNYFPTVAAWQAGFVDFAAGDYRLNASSPYRNAATDGSDVGADVGIVDAHVANALSGDDRLPPGENRAQTTTALPDDEAFNQYYGSLVQDTFAGTAGTTLPSHQPDINLTGSAWTVNGGSPTPRLTTTGVGLTATGAGHMPTTINAGIADVKMGADYRVGSGPGMGALVVRLTDANNFIVLETYLNTLYFYKAEGGAWTVLASQPLPAALAAGSTHRLEVRTRGTELEWWWDGVRLLQTSSTFQQTATRHGLDWNSAYDATTVYDNFELALNSIVPVAPTITAQPPSQSISSEQSAAMSVSASSGTTVSYQWYVGTSGTTTVPLAGATASSYTTPALAASANYWVRVSNSAGSTNSATAAVTVNATATGMLVQDTFTGTAGTLLTSHQADVNLTGNSWSVNGGSPTPRLTAAGVGLTATGTGHLPTTINAGVADVTMGVDYRVGSGPRMGALVVRLTDANNFIVLETYLNTLYFYKAEGGAWTVLASQPLPAALAAGSTHRLEVRTRGTGLEGWWDGVRLLQTSSTFQQTATRHGLDWNSAYDATTVYDNFELDLNATLSSAPAVPTIAAQPQSATIVSGQPATVSVTATGSGPFSYQWYLGTSGATTTPIAGATSSSYTTPALTAAANYWVRVTNTAASADSVEAAITVNAAPTGLLVQDSFTGTAGTTLTAHQADTNLTGNGWIVNGGSPIPQLMTGRVGLTATGEGHLPATVNTGVSDIEMAVDYRVGSGPGMGALIVRLTDANNFIVLETYLNTLYFYKRQGGAWLALGSRALPTALAAGSTHRLSVRAVGATLEGWWDGVRLLQINDSFQQTATRHGLDWNSAYDATSTYTNFQLQLPQ